MNLVEILARELEVWPQDAQELGQWPAGEICIRAASTGQPCAKVYESSNIATDVDAWCTRAQWEAERARILLESQRQRDQAIQEITSSVSVGYQLERDHESEEVKRYEQVLWDRVAQGWIAGASADAQCSWSTSAIQGHVEIACDVADAFMAERAKRLKGGA